MPAAPHTVAETDLYLARCNKLGLSQEARDQIIDQVSLEPAAGDVIKGSGGIRKVRFMGRGGYRVLVLYFNASAPAYLMSILLKSQNANFTAAQIKFLHGMSKGILKDMRIKMPP